MASSSFKAPCPLLWLLLATSGGFLPCLSSHAQIVINEIHYDPDVKTEPAEFVELYNAGSGPVDLSGWRFSSGVDYTFPPSTTLGPGEYLVVAQDPAFLQASFGGNALGPFSGRLSNDGETVRLDDASGQKRDEVDYQPGFPWPTVGDPPGYSIELVHPSLENDLGGSWRASHVEIATLPSQTLLPGGSTWRYFKGISEASTPSTEWRSPSFDDSTWLTGATPIGYEPVIPMQTYLSDMRSNYISVFLRNTFVVTNIAELNTVFLDALYDDGFKVWINGHPVLDANLPSGEVPFNATAGVTRDSDLYETNALPALQGYLMPGTNVIAVQAHNSGLGDSSDFYIDVRLWATTGPGGLGPTPGKRNAFYTNNIPPQIRQVDHSPNEPRSNEDVIVTAKVTDPDGVAGVQLEYQIVDPGAYIELTDPAYDSNWTSAAMNDSGINGDFLAGDSVYSARLPASLQVHRRLVRYRITAIDTGNRSIKVPYEDDPQPNFAYFVYDGVPAWSGAAHPGATPVVDFDTNVMRSVPSYHLIARNDSVMTATGWNPGASDNQYSGDNYLWSGTLVYDGKVYDHIHYRMRGGAGRYFYGRNMWKFKFNRGHEFQARDNYGKKYKTRWKRLNLGPNFHSIQFSGNRGEHGMFESLSFRLLSLVGVEALNTHFIEFRIIDDAVEANPANQYEGDFWGLYLALEQPDGRFLDEHGLPDGNFYKMEGPPNQVGGGELNNLGPAGPVDKSDLVAFQDAYLNTAPSDDWWRTNLDLPRYYSYQAIVQAVHHYDLYGKNYFFHRNPETGIWSTHPWDMDATWSDAEYPAGKTGGDEPFKSRVLSDFTSPYSHPQFTREFKNRVREIRDLLFNTDQAWQLIDEYASLITSPGGGPSIVDADRAVWDYNPVLADPTIVNLSETGQGYYYEAAASGDFQGMVQNIKDYVVYRATDNYFSLDVLAEDSQIPATPGIVSTSATNYPVNALSFHCSSFSGSSTFASMEWRIGEVTDTNAPAYDPTEPRAYEITPVWESGELTAFDADVSIPAGVVKVGHAHRARVRMKDATGRWSHWSNPVQFVSGESDNLVALTGQLKITELMYHPPAGSEYEFIELQNSSSLLPLQLAGVKFTSGIDYTFPAGATLGPREQALVVRASSVNNFAAFRSFYGLTTNVLIFGPYAGGLSDGGEKITLKTGPAGTEIVSFTYGDGRGWPISADGSGHSLVPLSRAETNQASGGLDYGGNWRRSTHINGSPGQADPSPPAGTMRLNEITAHTDYSDPAYPEYDSNDWIELFNGGPSSVNLAGWYLTDDPADLQKWALPALDLPSNGRITFDEITGFHSPITTGFGLDKAGEQVLLSYLPGTAQNRVVDEVRFEGQENGTSLGRYPDGTPYFHTMSLTRDSANIPPSSALTITEVMYRPPSVGPTNNTADEFVELFNPTDTSVSLQNGSGPWRLKGAVDYDFPTGTMLSTNSTLLVVNFDPADTGASNAFRSLYGITTSVRMLGPYSGGLDNLSGRVALERPQEPDVPGGPISWVIVDEVIYGNSAPWPGSANGTGDSLQRVSVLPSGNDPSNWTAGIPSPGSYENTFNHPPVASNLMVQLMEDTPTNLTLPGSDPENPVTFTAVQLPANGQLSNLDANSGTVTYTPNSNFNGLDSFAFVVSDGSLQATGLANLTISPVNDRPVLTVPGPQAVDEMAALVVTNSADDVDALPGELTFSGLDIPTNASLDAMTGILSWIPLEHQGPGTNVLVIKVTDDGTPPMSDTNSFTVIVNEVNQSPALVPINDHTIIEGRTLLVTNSATDADIPANMLLFSLEDGSPLGMTIGANGVLSWVPDSSQVPGTNLVGVIVADDGSPALSVTQHFQVESFPSEFSIESIALSNASVVISWNSIPGQTYRIEYQSELPGTNWVEVQSGVLASGPSTSAVDTSPGAPHRYYRVIRLE